MRLGLLMSLVSALQICQQSVLTEPSEDLPAVQFSLASAAFPLGKFVSTLALAVFPTGARKALFFDAILLLIGSILAAVPITFFLCVGRFLMGCGAGIGFVCATVLLFEMIPYRRRPAHFFVLGLAFAFATLMINFVRLLDFNQSQMILFSSIFTGGCGGLYLILGPHQSEYKVSEGEDEVEDTKLNPSQFPSTLIYALMTLNVAIGVPCILAFSHLIFEHFGASDHQASALSVAFPIAQIVLILILYNVVVDRKWLVVGGYTTALFMQVMLLITSMYPFLPPQHHTVAQCLFLWLLIVVSSVPCNTALVLIAEQFSDLAQQTQFTSKGRALMWILAAISTGTFPLSLVRFGFTISFLPYFLISTISLVVVAKIYPSSLQQL